MFLFFALSAAQVANTAAASSSTSDTPNTSDLLFIALGFGFSLAANIWVFFRISGGLFNPAVRNSHHTLPIPPSNPPR